MVGDRMKTSVELHGTLYIDRSVIMDHFGITPTTFYRWRDKGLLPKPIKLGKGRFYAHDEVENILSRGE
jgi:predicted DNA-binding transcriptional regulator AlpA